MRLLFTFSLSLLLFSSCNQQSKQIDHSKSEVLWYVSFGATNHEGRVPIKNYELELSNNAPLGFCVLDMQNIQELGGPENSTLSDIFIAHLKSNDFLKTDSFPTSKLTFAPYNSDSLKGELSLLGQTKTIYFPYSMVTKNDTISLNSSFNINRKDFNINKGGLLDQMGLPKDDTIQFKIQLIAY